MTGGLVGPGVRYGANYVPSRGWFYSWLDFDGDEVRRDLADLVSLGLDHIRIFPIWPWIQPNRGLIRHRAVEDLLTVMDLAAEAGLDVAVDLVQGHLSSFDFQPSWMLTWHAAGVFTDGRVRDGLAEYVSTLAAQVATRPNCLAVTLGNEVNNLYPASATDLAASSVWAAELLDAARTAAPGLPVVYSLFDAAWYDPDHRFGAADTVELGDVTSVHSWVFNGTSAIDGPLGPATTSHADYLVSLAAAFGSAERPVWLQEIGAPQPDIPADLARTFLAGTLTSVLTNPSLCGVTWWCSHDIDRSLLDFPDREYDLGLFTTDHRAKPLALGLREFLQRNRTRSVRVERPGLLCPVDPVRDPGSRAMVAPGSAFHREWVRRRGFGPVAIVAPKDAQDPAALRARGIREVLRTDPTHG